MSLNNATRATAHANWPYEIDYCKHAVYQGDVVIVFRHYSDRLRLKGGGFFLSYHYSISFTTCSGWRPFLDDFGLFWRPNREMSLDNTDGSHPSRISAIGGSLFYPYPGHWALPRKNGVSRVALDFSSPKLLFSFFLTLILYYGFQFLSSLKKQKARMSASPNLYQHPFRVV
jgi:hypothetical protein